MPFRGKEMLAFEPTVAEIRRLYRNDMAKVGPIPETQKNIEKLLQDYNKLTVDIDGGGGSRGLVAEIKLQEAFAKSLVKEQEDLKPSLANRYAEAVLVLQRQNALLSRKQELQKIGVASGTTP